MAVNTYPSDYSAGQLLSADDVNTIKDNGVIQVDAQADLNDLAAEVKIAYVVDESTVYFRSVSGWHPLASTTEIVEYEPMVGTIQMWWGSGDSIDQANLARSGWYICNGGNGTPDLRGRAPVGAGADNTALVNVDKGANVGAETQVKTLTAAQTGLYSHRHTLRPHSTWTSSTYNNYVAGRGSPQHRHYINAEQKPLKGDSSATGKWVLSGGVPNKQTYNEYGETGYLPWANYAGASRGHTHTTSIDAAGTNPTASISISVVQPSFGVHFIMYKGVTP